MSSFRDKKDAYGQVLKPGDVCARSSNNKVQLIVYKGVSWGGSKSKGEFGRFIMPTGTHSFKYSSVVLAFDPMGGRRNKAPEVTQTIRQFYEGK